MNKHIILNNNMKDINIDNILKTGITQLKREGFLTVADFL